MTGESIQSGGKADISDIVIVGFGELSGLLGRYSCIGLLFRMDDLQIHCSMSDSAQRSWSISHPRI